MESRQHTLAAIAGTVGVSRATIIRALAAPEQPAARPSAGGVEGVSLPTEAVDGPAQAGAGEAPLPVQTPAQEPVPARVCRLSLATLMGPGACHDLGTTWVAW